MSVGLRLGWVLTKFILNKPNSEIVCLENEVFPKPWCVVLAQKENHSIGFTDELHLFLGNPVGEPQCGELLKAFV